MVCMCGSFPFPFGPSMPSLKYESDQFVPRPLRRRVSKSAGRPIPGATHDPPCPGPHAWSTRPWARRVSAVMRTKSPGPFILRACEEFDLFACCSLSPPPQAGEGNRWKCRNASQALLGGGAKTAGHALLRRGAVHDQLEAMHVAVHQTAIGGEI